jgi:PqqA peptide cyclase
VLTGDAAHTDPFCALSPDHALLAGARREAEEASPDFVYRQHSNPTPPPRPVVLQSG